MITALLFFTALFIGMPIVFLLIFGTLVSIYELNMDLLLPIVPQQIFRSFEKAGLLAIPMFMLVGELMNVGGITRRLMNLADLFVGRFRGGLAYVNLLTNTLASAILGSATAQIAMMCRVMVKPMTDRGYDKGYATGLTIASGMLGAHHPALHGHDHLRNHRLSIRRRALYGRGFHRFGGGGRILRHHIHPGVFL